MFSFSILSFFFQRRKKKKQNTDFYCLIKLSPHFSVILFSVNFNSCFLCEMKYQETGHAVKIFINFSFVFNLVWKIILSVSAAPRLSFPYSCTLLADSEWHLTVSLIRDSKWWLHNFVDLRWDHVRYNSGFWKWYKLLKIFFVKQVRNMIASLLIRMNITAVSSRCHKLYGYIRDLTQEHSCS